jgi:para-nitrobenzyl esterase
MKSISRKQFLFQSALGLGSVMLFSGFDSTSTKTDGDFVIGETAFGKVRGRRERGVNIFKGIPYGGSVSGDYRFARPAPLEPWKGVKDAIRLGTPAMQSPKTVYGIDEPQPGEDCLFLNIWTPANDNRKRPVLFYNHGGGFSTGSGGSAGQDGANLARFFDVVVVETNHRLNIFGYLYLGDVAGEDYKTSGNNGMLDIVDGLKWVKQNIAEFGGNPDNVMICGESGGGAKTSCLYSMPSAADYFNKASIESGPGVMMTPVETAIETTSLLFKELNISRNDWHKLLEIPSDKLFDIQPQLMKAAASVAAVTTSPTQMRGIGASGLGGFSPVVDGIVMTRHPFSPDSPEISLHKPLMIGWNEDEYTFFANSSGDISGYKLEDFDALHKKIEPKFGKVSGKILETYRTSRPEASPSAIYNEIMSVTFMGLGSIEIAEKKAKQNEAPVYLYNFGYKSGLKLPGTDFPMGTAHAMDIGFKFNNVRPEMPGQYLAGDKPERFKASLNFAGLWTSFARTGKPGVKNQPEWPAYDMIKRPTYRIDTECEIIFDRNKTERELWTSLGYLGGKD